LPFLETKLVKKNGGHREKIRKCIHGKCSVKVVQKQWHASSFSPVDFSPTCKYTNFGQSFYSESISMRIFASIIPVLETCRSECITWRINKNGFWHWIGATVAEHLWRCARPWINVCNFFKHIFRISATVSFEITHNPNQFTIRPFKNSENTLSWEILVWKIKIIMLKWLFGKNFTVKVLKLVNMNI